MSLIIEGKVWRFGNDLDTDELFSGRYIMTGNVQDKQSYKMAIIRGAFESLSTIGEGNENVPEGFLDAVSRVLSGYEHDQEEDKNALQGHLVIAGYNFGLGSSRQQAAEAMRFFGISACVAETIHRIFFRNFWNLGGVALDQEGVSSLFETGDLAQIDLTSSIIRNLTSNKEMQFSIHMPEEFIDMYKVGGLIAYHRKR